VVPVVSAVVLAAGVMVELASETVGIKYAARKGGAAT
jgi:hypothetical protein